MSLDLTILSPAGDPVESVALGVDEHHELMEHAQKLSLASFLRLRDYYDDVELSVAEVEETLRDIMEARAQGPSSNLDLKLAAMEQLFSLARLQQKSIFAIAD